MKKKKTSARSRLSGKKVTLRGAFEDEDLERLTALIGLHRGAIVKALDASIDYLVVPDLMDAPTAQRTAKSLNAKGAAIEIYDFSTFDDFLEPTAADIAAFIREGSANVDSLRPMLTRDVSGWADEYESPPVVISRERFDGVDLSGFDFERIEFDRCSFVGAILNKTRFASAVKCDFSKTTGESSRFRQVEQSRFTRANLSDAEFHSHFDGCDFTGAQLERFSF